MFRELLKSIFTYSPNVSKDINSNAGFHYIVFIDRKKFLCTKKTTACTLHFHIWILLKFIDTHENYKQ